MLIRFILTVVSICVILLAVHQRIVYGSADMLTMLGFIPASLYIMIFVVDSYKSIKNYKYGRYELIIKHPNKD